MGAILLIYGVPALLLLSLCSALISGKAFTPTRVTRLEEIIVKRKDNPKLYWAAVVIRIVILGVFSAPAIQINLG